MAKAKKNKGGANGKYRKWLEPESLILLEGWARDGLTDEQIAKNMGISLSTIKRWKKQYLPISTSLTKGSNRKQQRAVGENKLGRPPEPKYEVPFMIERIEAYIVENIDKVPILKECCFLNGWNYDYLMQLQRKHELLSQSTKRLLDLKEVRLEKGMLTGKLVTTGAVFSLKQLGWRDRVEQTLQVEHKGNELINAIRSAGSLFSDKELNQEDKK